MTPAVRLEVPFYANDGDGSRCMQVAARMALAFFGKDVAIEELEARSGRFENGWTWSVQIARVLHELGADVRLHSENDGSIFLAGERAITAALGEELFAILERSGNLASIRESVRYCRDHDLVGEPLELDDLRRALDSKRVPLVLIDYNRLLGRAGYHGHMIPLVGYDDAGFAYHESGPMDPTPFAHVDSERFERAWTARGTDLDAIIVRGLRG